jgi:hypothetical protein
VVTPPAGGPQDSAAFPPCACLDAPSRDLIFLGKLGSDRAYAEVTVLLCPTCGRTWLRYFFELEAFTASGRWYLAPIEIAQVQALAAEEARAFFAGLDWYFYGGSYYHGKTGTTSGPLLLNP